MWLLALFHLLADPQGRRAIVGIILVMVFGLVLVVFVFGEDARTPSDAERSVQPR